MSPLSWLESRTGLVTAFEKVTHWTVPASRCLCRFLPVAIVFGFILQGLTGLFLWAFYSPSAQTAWESVFYVQYHLPYGWLVRGIHHFSAQLLVGTLLVYVLLMILHGAYRKPREFVYWSAIVMFLFTLASCLTGDLLSWSLSGYFATITRVSFLQILPKIGVPLYQLVVGGPDPQFGTLTLTRFTVLHIAVFGGGFLVVMLFWKWADIRSRALAQQMADQSCALACGEKKQRSFWGCEAVASALTCVIFLAATILLVFQHSMTEEQIASHADTIPSVAYLGADLSSPADPGYSYDAARPEWSFRALYYMSKLSIFSKIGMIFAIFVIPGLLAAYFFALPILGNIKILHYAIVAITSCLFVVFCWFTWASYWDDYRNPEHAPAFLAAQEQADVLKRRSVELALAPKGIPNTGALGLLQSDPYVQGPRLFQQHCASCHNFKPFNGQEELADYAPISCPEPTAPNLYQSGSVAWIQGFHDKDLLISDDYFGKTTSFGKKGSMYGLATGRVFGGLIDKSGKFVLNPTGLIAPLIAPDAGPAFDIYESALNSLAKDDKSKELVKKGEYIPKLKEAIVAKFNDAKFVQELKIPQPVCDALKSVLLEILDDKEFVDLLKDEDNITSILDDDVATFLEDTFLAALNGNGEPFPPEKTKYIDRLRNGIITSCNEMAEVLHEESNLTAPRPLENGKYKGLRENAIADMNYLTCTECHAFYGNEKKDLACDLRGYMSKSWLVGIISDPTTKTYYGKKNDRMPAYRPQTGDALLSAAEVDMLADWMKGKWYHAPKEDHK